MATPQAETVVFIFSFILYLLPQEKREEWMRENYQCLCHRLPSLLAEATVFELFGSVIFYSQVWKLVTLPNLLKF